MPSKKILAVTGKEAPRRLIEEPIVSGDISFKEFSISIQVGMTRRKISLTVNNETAEVLYNDDRQITAEMLEEELTRHSSLLKLAKSLCLKWHAITKRAVDREIGDRRVMQFTPPQLQAVIIKIYEILMSLFFQKTTDKDILTERMYLAFVSRCIAEINKQKEIYEGTQVEGADKQLAELVRVMEELIWTLSNVAQSMDNTLQADLRRLGAMGFVDDSD